MCYRLKKLVKIFLLCLPYSFEKNLFNLIYLMTGKQFGIKSWYLSYRIGKKLDLRLEKFKNIIPPRNAFWADPHILFYKNVYYVFFEEYSYLGEKGHISFLTISPSGEVSPSKKVLETNYHLSYPFVFQDNDIHYMVPESSKANRIDLFRSTNFPYAWTFVKTLIPKIEAVDTNLLRYKDKWWLFTSIRNSESKSADSNLHIFYSDNLFTNNWVPHPGNPILSNDSSSRSGGNIIELNNKLYRPSQDCKQRYGFGLYINRIEELSTDSYKEKRLGKLSPENFPFIRGIHTFNRCKKISVVDMINYRHNAN